MLTIMHVFVLLLDLLSCSYYWTFFHSSSQLLSISISLICRSDDEKPQKSSSTYSQQRLRNWQIVLMPHITG